MTELTLSELWQSAPAQALLLRHREASLREVTAANRDKLFRIAQAVQPAVLKVLKDQEPTK
jgi:hypothetical protein